MAVPTTTQVGNGGVHGGLEAIAHQPEGRAGGRVYTRGCALITTLAVPLVALAALANLPTAAAMGGPFTLTLPVCLAGCTAAAGTAALAAPWTAIAVWTACKNTCIALALVG